MIRHGVLAGLALACAATAAAQSLPRSVRDLAPGSFRSPRTPEATQQALRERGYALVHTDARPTGTWQYWWSARDRVCLQLTQLQARVDKLSATSETDCNQLQGDPARQSPAARVAVAAARAVGVDALLHKSHERDTTRHQDVAAVADFERGYRDALAGRGQSERGRSAAYADGHRGGLARRGLASGAVPLPGLPPVVGAPVRNTGELVGRHEAELEAAMRSLGYTRRAGHTKGNESFSTWRGPSPSMCVMVAARNGRVESVGEVLETSCL